jgi:hypothetical protein
VYTQRTPFAIIREGADARDPEGLVGKGIDAGVTVESMRSERVVLSRSLRYAGIRYAENIERFEQRYEIDLEKGIFGYFVLRGSWCRYLILVRCEERPVEVNESFKDAAFFSTEAEALRGNVHMCFLGKRNAAQEHEDLTGRGGNSGEK